VATAGDYIREARQGRGWNQSELAERVSASTTTVSNWERGITKPGLDDINALCSALGLSADVLLGKLGVTLTPPAAARLPRELVQAALQLDAFRLVSGVKYDDNKAVFAVALVAAVDLSVDEHLMALGARQRNECPRQGDGFSGELSQPLHGV